MTILVYLVAGISSRFGGFPKPLVVVTPSNETLIEYSVNQAIKNSFSKIIFVTNSKTEILFKNIFGNTYKNIPIEYIEQKYNNTERSRPWGTTDALCSILNIVNLELKPIILINGDDIYGNETFKNGFNLMKQENINIIGGLKVIKTLPETGYVNRGIIFINTENNKVTDLEEMLNISKTNNPELHNELANINFIGLQPNILFKLKKILDSFKKEHSNDEKIECLLPNNLNELIQSKELELQFFEVTDEIIGITNPGDENIIRDKLLHY
tara:strand:- start:1385 stop:2191 length:807 start_codon:yes stop_codon:yes gene_type:complete